MLEAREFPENLARTQDSENNLTPFGASTGQLHPPLFDQMASLRLQAIILLLSASLCSSATSSQEKSAVFFMYQSRCCIGTCRSSGRDNWFCLLNPL
jgi:hypothetical protein